MNEERIQAYLTLIQQLLTCPNGEEPQILNQSLDLVDEGFVQVCELVAQQLQEAGEENQAGFLRNLAQQLGEYLNASGGEGRETQGNATDEEYFNFLMELLQATDKSQGNPSVVYPLLQKNLDKLNLRFAKTLQAWASQKLSILASRDLSKSDERKALNTAADIGSLAKLISDFPLGSRSHNLEIVIAAYEIISTFTQQKDPRTWAIAQINLGVAYRNRIEGEQADNKERAISAYQKALKVYTRESSPQEWAMIQNNLATAYSKRIKGKQADNLETAIATFQAALEVYTRESSPQKWAMIQNNLGNTYLDHIKGEQADNQERAIVALQAALEVYTPEAFPEEWATTQNNLGEVYRQRIRGERAKNLEKAIKFYEAALTVRTREKYPEKWAMTQNNLGKAYLNPIEGNREDNMEKAIAACQAALKIYTRTAFPEQWADTQNNLGNTYLDRIKGVRADNIEKAIAAFKAALEIYTREAFPQKWAMTQTNLGAAYQNRIKGKPEDNLKLAISAHQAVLEIYTRAAFPQNHAETLFNLGVAYREAFQLQNADDTFAKAIDTIEEIRSGIIEGGEADKQKLAEKWQKLYREMVEVCLELNKYAAALEYAERSKARNLVELLAATRLKPKDVSSEIWERYDYLYQQWWNLQQRRDSSDFSFSNSFNNDDTRIEISRTLTQLRKEIDDFIATEITPQDPKFRFGQQVQPIPYREIQALVDEHTAIVEWYFTSKGIHAFIVTDQGQQPIVVSTDSNALAALEQLKEEYLNDYLKDDNHWRQQLSSYLQQLAEILQLDHLISQIPPNCQQLVLIPYRALHLFPLHALPLNKGGEEITYLSDKFPQGIRYAPSSQILQLSLSEDSLIDTVGEFGKPNPPAPFPTREGGAGKPLSSQGRGWGGVSPHKQFANSTFISDNQAVSLFAIQNPTEDLAYTDIEVEAIQTAFNSPTILKGEDASKTAFNQKSTELNETIFAHFSCHGYFNFANPRISGLILANAKLSETTATEKDIPRIRSRRGEFNADECLTLPEIFNLRLRQCRLVALSACETGITDISTSSDEYISILAGFFFAGARNVLGTLWAVNDVSTAIFMIHFYEILLGEKQIPVALALKQTQEWMRSRTVADLLNWINNCKLISEERRQEMCDDLTLGWKRKLDVKRYESPYYWAAFCAVGQ